MNLLEATGKHLRHRDRPEDITRESWPEGTFISPAHDGQPEQLYVDGVPAASNPEPLEGDDFVTVASGARNRSLRRWGTIVASAAVLIGGAIAGFSRNQEGVRLAQQSEALRQQALVQANEANARNDQYAALAERLAAEAETQRETVAMTEQALVRTQAQLELTKKQRDEARALAAGAQSQITTLELVIDEKDSVITELQQLRDRTEASKEAVQDIIEETTMIIEETRVAKIESEARIEEIEQQAPAKPSVIQEMEEIQSQIETAAENMESIRKEGYDEGEEVTLALLNIQERELDEYKVRRDLRQAKLDQLERDGLRLTLEEFPAISPSDAVPRP